VRQFHRKAFLLRWFHSVQQEGMRLDMFRPASGVGVLFEESRRIIDEEFALFVCARFETLLLEGILAVVYEGASPRRDKCPHPASRCITRRSRYGSTVRRFGLNADTRKKTARIQWACYRTILDEVVGRRSDRHTLSLPSFEAGAYPTRRPRRPRVPEASGVGNQGGPRTTPRSGR